MKLIRIPFRAYNVRNLDNDMASLFQNETRLESMRRNLDTRQFIVDLEKIRSKWKELLKLRQRINEIENEQKILNKKILSIVRDGNMIPEDLKVVGRRLRKKHQEIHENELNPTELMLRRAFRQLPNSLHEFSARVPKAVAHPLRSDDIFSLTTVYRSVRNKPSSSNFALRSFRQLLDYCARPMPTTDPVPWFEWRSSQPKTTETLLQDKNSFITSKMAIIHDAIPRYFRGELLKLLKKETIDVEEVDGPSLIKSSVIDDCGLDSNDTSSIYSLNSTSSTSDNDRLHVVGNASLPSLVTNLRHQTDVITPKIFLTNGRYYSVKRWHEANCVSVLGVTGNESKYNMFNNWKNEVRDTNDMYKYLIDKKMNSSQLDLNKTDHMFQCLLHHFLQIYTQLDMHFRLVNVNAADLKKNESLRLEIHCFSPSTHQYIPVARLAILNDYISRRSDIHISSEGKQNIKFPQMIYGSLVYTPFMFVTLIENRQLPRGSKKIIDIPDKLEPYLVNRTFI
ncbi:hypothetical protein SNEBB_000329 [Seison nebaliae]|nr:hypothetical protein SNEBB_000329 [Seison nebaliae]